MMLHTRWHTRTHTRRHMQALIHTFLRTHTLAHNPTHALSFTHTHTLVYTNPPTKTSRTHTYINTRAYIHIHVCPCICAYIHGVCDYRKKHVHIHIWFERTALQRSHSAQYIWVTHPSKHILSQTTSVSSRVKGLLFYLHSQTITKKKDFFLYIYKVINLYVNELYRYL